MTTHATSPKPLLSTGARIAAAAGVIALVAAAWTLTEHESHRAVIVATTAINGPTYVTLPPVEIVAHRDRVDAVAASHVYSSEL